MKRLLDGGIRFYLVLVLIFLYLPILVMALFAFNKSPLYALPFEFDLVWFKALAEKVDSLDPIGQSLKPVAPCKPPDMLGGPGLKPETGRNC